MLGLCVGPRTGHQNWGDDNQQQRQIPLKSGTLVTSHDAWQVQLGPPLLYAVACQELGFQPITEGSRVTGASLHLWEPQAGL